MNPSLTESKAECERRLLTDLYAIATLHGSALRAREWETAASLSGEMARLERLLILNQNEK